MTTPNYKNLYEQALFHLRCVSGSRNSFTPEMHERMTTGERIQHRTPGVEKMHQDAVNFLRIHDNLCANIPQPDYVDMITIVT